MNLFNAHVFINILNKLIEKLHDGKKFAYLYWRINLKICL